MVRVEKLENVIVDDKIAKVVMTVNDGTNEIENEVYLAFSDESTRKRYIVYTSEQAKSETDRIPFTLGTISLGENGYIIEETSKEDHQNLELPILNIIGLNADKDLDEVKKMITDKFPSIMMSDLQVLKTNVANITISETKPPKKANMPIAIANGIKKFYLYQLNKELKKVYNATEMSDEEKQASIERLDNIESKLDSVNEMYLANAEKRGGLTNSMEKSIEEINTAKKDIEAAKNRLQTLQSDYTEELQNDLEETVAEEGLEQPTESTPEEVELPEVSSEELNSQEIEETVETAEEEIQTPEVETVEETSVESEENVETKVDEEIETPEVVDEAPVEMEQPVETPEVEEEVPLQVEESVEPKSEISVNELIEQTLAEYRRKIDEEIKLEMANTLDKFSESVDSFVEKVKNDIRSIYEQQLEEQTRQHQNEMLSISAGFTALKEKSEQEIQQAREMKEKNNALQQENEELKSTIDSQKTLLDQQNSNMNDLKGEINQLREEKENLLKYKSAYEQVVQMVGNLKPVDPQQQMIDDVVEHVIGKQA